MGQCGDGGDEDGVAGGEDADAPAEDAPCLVRAGTRSEVDAVLGPYHRPVAMGVAYAGHCKNDGGAVVEPGAACDADEVAGEHCHKRCPEGLRVVVDTSEFHLGQE